VVPGREGRSGMGAVRTWYSYGNSLCRVFRALVNLQDRNKCQALFERLGIDGEWGSLWCSELDFVFVVRCSLRMCVTFCDQNYLRILYASSGVLHVIMGCSVTDVSSELLCPVFNSEVALGYLGNWRWNKHPPRRCRTTYRSGLKGWNISFTVWTLNMKCVGCLEPSVRNYVLPGRAEARTVPRPKH